MTTKIIDATILRNNLGEAIEAVTSGDTLLVKKRGKLRVAIVDLDLFEDMLAGQSPEYRQSIAEARQQYKTGETMSIEEAFGE